ncbi:hypothetical protein FG379_001868 [Cryptosporidium bovis]|uniref:uncharacterized protein n=1 Tax=Cryptosporidium bovis TaxID=310047 RepID=UPI00351A6340|nr:hypothetical protein FG379_001868 [Cryptosporidium bovis]
MFWLIDWGVSCSQGGCKENQDGWFVTIPRNIKADKFTGRKCQSIKYNSDVDRNKASGYSKGVWNLDPLTQKISKAGSYDGFFGSCSNSIQNSPSNDKVERDGLSEGENIRKNTGARFNQNSTTNSSSNSVSIKIPDNTFKSASGFRKTSKASNDAHILNSFGGGSNCKGNRSIELDIGKINLSQTIENDSICCITDKELIDDQNSHFLSDSKKTGEYIGRGGHGDGNGDDYRDLTYSEDEQKRIDQVFPVAFPLFPLPPLQPKKTGPNWVSHTSGGKSCSNLGIEEISRSCQFFGLLDGHGHYGKMASHLAAYCLSETLVKGLSDIRDDISLGDYLETVIDVLNKGFNYAHESVIKANISSKKDFGTTCIVVGIVDKYLVTANCGDSSAICIVPNQKKRAKTDLINENLGIPKIKKSNLSDMRLPDLPIPLIPRKKTSSSIYDINGIFCGSGALNTNNLGINDTGNRNSKQYYHKIYYLSNPHCLVRKSERQRIDQSGVGKVVLGDYGMLRLIPSYLTYQQARDMGLSISMSRSLGHMHLSRCALLPTPDYRIFNIGIGSPKKESLRSIRGAEEKAIKRREDEKMISFSEALVEQSVISLGWRNSRPSHNPANKPHIESIELDWCTDDDNFINNSCVKCSHCNETKDDNNEGEAQNECAIKNEQIDEKDRNSGEWEECYVVIMSDGISDILDGFSIADIIVNSVDKTLEEIAGIITSEAERKRRFNNIRADNCTAIVIRIGTKPRLEIVKGNTGKNETDANFTDESRKNNECAQQKTCELSFSSILSSCKNRSSCKSANSTGETENRSVEQTSPFYSPNSSNQSSYLASGSKTVVGNIDVVVSPKKRVSSDNVCESDVLTGNAVNESKHNTKESENKTNVGLNPIRNPTNTAEGGNASSVRSNIAVNNGNSRANVIFEPNRLTFTGRRNLRNSRIDIENSATITSIGAGNSSALRSENNILNSSLRRSFTPIIPRRRVATPSPSRARTCKLREIPSFFQRNNT